MPDPQVVPSGSTVYFVQIGGISMTDFLYDYSSFRDEVFRPWFCLREAIEKAGYKVGFCSDQCANYDGSILNDVATIISINEARPPFIANMSNYSKEKLFLIELDPPVVLPYLADKGLANHFGKIFTLFDDKVDNEQFVRLYYPQPRMQMIDGVPGFDEKKFCTLINSNSHFSHPNELYSERRKAIAFFTNATNEFDLYGREWHGYQAWKGAPPAKWEVLKNYKFCICYENMGDR